MNQSDSHAEPEFEEFLVNAGLSLENRRGPQGEPFGNWLIQYGNADLQVSIVLDRGHTGVTISDKNTLRPYGVLPPEPATWDASLIRECLFGISEIGMTFDDEKAFVRKNWDAIKSMFSSESRKATHERLALLGRERMKRKLEPWPPVIADFEAFLKSSGFVCDAHEAPDGALGKRLMLYHNALVNVRIESEGGWRLALAERATRPDAWYDILTLHKLLLGDVKAKFPFMEWFSFARANWDSIVALFTADRRENSHRQLEPLEQETRERRRLARERQAAQIEELEKKMRALRPR